MLKKLKLTALLMFSGIFGYSAEEKADLRVQKSAAGFDTAFYEMQLAANELYSEEVAQREASTRKRQEAKEHTKRELRIYEKRAQVKRRMLKVYEFTSF